MKSFEEFVIRGIVKNQSPNINRARSLCEESERLKPGPGESYKTILVTQKIDSEMYIRGTARYVVRLPQVNLTRMGLVKMATVIGFSQGVLLVDERFVFVTGIVGFELDTIVLMTVGKEF